MERPDPGSADLTEPEVGAATYEEPSESRPSQLPQVDLSGYEPVRIADPEPAPATEPPALPEPVAIERPTRSRALPALLAILLVGLLAGIGLVALDASAADRRDDARQAALQAARAQAVNLTTISYETADRDLARIIDAATGTLKTQFEAQRAQFPAVLRREKSVSVGTVLAAGVSSQSGSVVEALVAVDATVTSASSGASGVVKHYRMDMRLVRSGNRWLVGQVAFAGLPQ